MALRDKVLSVMHPGEKYTAQALWEALGEPNTRRASVNNALQDLHKTGLVERDASGKEHIYSVGGSGNRARPTSQITTVEELHSATATGGGGDAFDRGAELAERLREIFEQLDNLKAEKLEILKRLETI